MAEFDLISWIMAQQRTSTSVLRAAGDDLAILNPNPGDLLLVGIDQVLEGVHFDSKIHAPEQIGRKVVNRNLSDCAAMACLPFAMVMSWALPRGRGEDYAKRLYAGMKQAGDAFDCPIVGGDTGSWDHPLCISVAIVGRTAGIAPIQRNGAKPGDFIYVTGPLGGSILGRHLSFTPRIREARELAQKHRITAMIDISDGLSRDLAHICRQSGVGAILQSEAIPVHEDVSNLNDAKSPLDHALNDGEDHELCFTSPDRIEGVTFIGQITAHNDLTIVTPTGPRPLAAKSWEHVL